jgi:gluconokinase
VSGSGKSTLSAALSRDLNMPLFDADDLHPKSNVEKMSSGEPLTDADREPWLERVRTTAQKACAEQQVDRSAMRLCGVVIACSALKKYYRDILRGTHKPNSVPSHLEPPEAHALPTYIVFISGPRQILVERMNARKGHFMKTALLDSQLQTLESPEGEGNVITVDLEASTDLQVRRVKERFHELRVEDIK